MNECISDVSPGLIERARVRGNSKLRCCDYEIEHAIGIAESVWRAYGQLAVCAAPMSRDHHARLPCLAGLLCWIAGLPGGLPRHLYDCSPYLLGGQPGPGLLRG